MHCSIFPWGQEIVPEWLRTDCAGGPRRAERRSQTSAFDNGSNMQRQENSLLEKYLTDSIHVKC